MFLDGFHVNGLDAWEDCSSNFTLKLFAQKAIHFRHSVQNSVLVDIILMRNIKQLKLFKIRNKFMLVKLEMQICRVFVRKSRLEKSFDSCILISKRLKLSWSYMNQCPRQQCITEKCLGRMCWFFISFRCPQNLEISLQELSWWMYLKTWYITQLSLWGDFDKFRVLLLSETLTQIIF